MKKLLQGMGFLVLISMLACTQPSPPLTLEKPHAWVFDVTPQTTIHQIDSVSMAWRKDSIDLQFTKLEYSDEGKLMIASGSVSFMAKGNLPSGKFTQDTVSKKLLEIKLDNRPSISIGDK